MMSFAGKPCTLHCPKCRKQNLWLSEVWNNNGIYFKIVDGKMPREAEDHFQGAPVCVIAECSDCQHIWRVRGGVTSVWDLVEGNE